MIWSVSVVEMMKMRSCRTTTKKETMASCLGFTLFRLRAFSKIKCSPLLSQPIHTTTDNINEKTKSRMSIYDLMKHGFFKVDTCQSVGTRLCDLDAEVASTGKR